jgi:CheY-like chemotaxis protein
VNEASDQLAIGLGQPIDGVIQLRAWTLRRTASELVQPFRDSCVTADAHDLDPILVQQVRQAKQHFHAQAARALSESAYVARRDLQTLGQLTRTAHAGNRALQQFAQRRGISEHCLRIFIFDAILTSIHMSAPGRVSRQKAGEP